MRYSTLTSAVIHLVLFASLSTACSKKTPSSASSSLNGPDRPALQFEYQMTSEVLVAKSDARTGDHWTARLVRDGVPGPQNVDLWTIQMGPDEIASGDRKAYGSFVLHLLDTIRTLQVKEAPVSGTPESFGLAPPLFVLRWRVSEPRSGTQGALQARVFKEYEMRLGAPAKGEDGSFQGLYASFGGVPKKTFIVQGAALQMLDKIDTFQALRLPTLVTMASDDVDEIKIQLPKGRPFYAQRDGDRWTDAKHRAVKKDVQAFLDQATHLRILRFIDDPKEQSVIRSRFKGTALQTVILTDRKGHAETLQIASPSRDGKAYGTFSSRQIKSASGKESLAVFEVYPEILKEFSKF